MRSLRAQGLVLVRKGDAEQGGEVEQKLVVVVQRGAALKVAQQLHQELLQLQPGTRGGQQLSNALIQIWAITYDYNLLNWEPHFISQSKSRCLLGFLRW